MSCSKRWRKRKCLHCGEMYMPDPRTRRWQKYCSALACKGASKVAAQRKWQRKTDNKDYFCGDENVRRVQLWRATHPGYWKRCRKSPNALQDECLAQVIDGKQDRGISNLNALQDECFTQPAVVVGLIARLTGFTLQDEIAVYVRNMHSYGQMILGIGSGTEKGETGNDRKETVMPRAGSPHSAALQLG